MYACKGSGVGSLVCINSFLLVYGGHQAIIVGGFKDQDD
jgi:hypothetical protein